MSRPIKNKTDFLRIRDKIRLAASIEEVGYRNYIIFILGASTGFRTGDIVPLTIGDLNRAIKLRELSILESKKKNDKKVKEKNKKNRVATLQESTIRALKKYLAFIKEIDKNLKRELRRIDADYAFRNNKYKERHISVEAISRKIKKIALTYNLQDITSHSLRKTYAYNIYLICGKDITVVQEMLGHSSPRVTRDYIGLEKELYCNYSEKLGYIAE